MINNKSTLEKAKGWVKELQRQANSQIVIALVGNKLDLVEDHPTEEDEQGSRQVTYEEASSYASEAGLLFFETSARTSFNVDNVFREIGKIGFFSLLYWILMFNLAKTIPHDYLVNNRNGLRSTTHGGNTTLDILRETDTQASGCAC